MTKLVPKRPGLATRPLHRLQRSAVTVPVSRAGLTSRWGEAAISPVPARPALVDQGPYLDYSRSLTPLGGVLIIYKDLDQRWRQYIWKALAWCAASGAAAWYIRANSPIEGLWLNLFCWIVFASLNLLIVWQPVEVYRRLEIRPDCLILEGDEVFWREHMAGDGPQFKPDENNNLILGGVYGSRFVEFATLRRFDEFDRTSEAFTAHFAEAVQQLWKVD